MTSQAKTPHVPRPHESLHPVSLGQHRLPYEPDLICIARLGHTLVRLILSRYADFAVDL